MPNEIKLNILGTEYSYIEQSARENDRFDDDCAGYCEPYSKEIVVEINFPERKQYVKNINEFIQKARRHEIIHAFFFESGMDIGNSAYHKEDLVDWMACQLPKMVKVMQQVGAIEAKDEQG